MHENLEQLNKIDAKKYIISNDKPENQLELYTQLEDYFGESLTFISDPNLELVDHMDMKNGTTAYRGYALIDGDGALVFNTVNDYWGVQIEKSVKEINEALSKIESK